MSKQTELLNLTDAITANGTALKVDTIQTAAGGVPTASDLGINIAGSVLQVVRLISDSYNVAISAAGEYSILSKQITVSEGSKLLIFADSGQIQMSGSAIQNPSIGISVDTTVVITRNHTNHRWYNVVRNADSRVWLTTNGMSGPLTAGVHTIEIIAGVQSLGDPITYGFQGNTLNGDRRPSVVVWEIAA